MNYKSREQSPEEADIGIWMPSGSGKRGWIAGVEMLKYVIIISQKGLFH